MTAAGNRARRRDARLDQILDQAMSMLTVEGADALTLGRLAEAMSVTPAALYRYVASKDELVVRLQERSLAGLATIVARSREAWARSDVIQGAAPALRPLIALFGWARLYVRLREDDSPHIQLISVLVGDTRPVVSDDWARRVMPRWMALLGHAAEIIADAVACEVLAPGDATERAALLWASVHGIAQTHKLRRLASSVFAIRTLAREATAALALRWGATLADVEAASAAADRLRLRVPAT